MKSTIIFFTVLILFSTSSFAQSTKTPRSRPKVVPQCNLREAPRVRGFFLGQTVDEINKVIPNFREAYKFNKTDLSDRATERASSLEPDGVYYTVSLSDWDKDIDLTAANEMNYVKVGSSFPFGFESGKELAMPEEFEEVRIDWYFLKEKLYAFEVHYLEYEPKNIGSFVKQAAESLGLPANSWTDSKIGDGIGRWVHCRNFKVEVRIVIQGSPLVVITNTDVEAEILHSEKEILARMKKEARDRELREKRERETFKP